MGNGLSRESGVNAKENCVCVCTCVYTTLYSRQVQAKTKSPISILPTRTCLGHFYSIHASLLSHIKGKEYHKGPLQIRKGKLREGE